MAVFMNNVEHADGEGKQVGTSNRENEYFIFLVLNSLLLRYFLY